jgi:hypothetical protein
MVNIVASLNRIELQIHTQLEVGGEQTLPHRRLHLAGPGQGQAEMPLDLDRSLGIERVTAFGLGRAPSPPQIRVRVDNYSLDSCSDVIKSRASIFYFFFNFLRACSHPFATLAIYQLIDGFGMVA